MLVATPVSVAADSADKRSSMKRMLTALLIPFLLGLIAAPAAAASTSQMVVAIGDRATVDRSGSARVPVTITCSFQMATEQTSGTLTVNVTQATKSGTTTATGTVPITCDGTTRTYLVTVTPTTGSFRPGSITAQAQTEADGSFQQDMCVSYPDGTEECTVWNGTEILRGSDGPKEVLTTGSR
jgi:hypothetical protein